MCGGGYELAFVIHSGYSFSDEPYNNIIGVRVTCKVSKEIENICISM